MPPPTASVFVEILYSTSNSGVMIEGSPNPVESDNTEYHSRHAGEPAEPTRSGKKRKQRPFYSCEECRRLKMKCDRRAPCSNCVRRNRIELCTGTTATPRSPRRHDRAVHYELEVPPRHPSHEENLSISASLAHPSLEEQNVQHGTRMGATTRESENSSADDPSRSNAGGQDRLEQLAQLAHALEPYNSVSAASSRSPLLMSPGEITGPLSSAPSGTSGTSVSGNNPTVRSIDSGDHNGSHGTLILGKGGRSRYLGPTAGSEWLKDSETRDGSVTPMATRAPSPGVSPDREFFSNESMSFGSFPIAFPFATSAAHISTRHLLSRLPPKEEAWTLVESYYRYCSWHHDVAPKASFQETFDRVYAHLDNNVSSDVNPQEIALVFIILAQGTVFNIEIAINDPSAEDYLHLSEIALVKGEFLSNNTVAALQTLHLMAHLNLILDTGHRGNHSWSLWGLVVRLMHAMGLHRDGSRWNLPDSVVEERRKVFWECNAADTFQAHCFSRPCAINPEHCDTAFPCEPLGPNGDKGYAIVRYELSQLSYEILNMTVKVVRPQYYEVIELDLKLCEFERNLPFSLRCRAALLAMPSRYPQLEAAIEASPEPSRRSMTISFQQMSLALNISETIINLHRPYYAKALYDDCDGCESVYAPSYLTVIERCAIIIAIVTDIHQRFPAVSIRQWHFYFHVFNSALCLGTLVLREPGSAMATFALAQIDAAISVFSSLIQHGANTTRYMRNYQWLLKLRARASQKISAPSTTNQPPNSGRQRELREDREDGEDVELLGWRTRLIERAGQDHRETIRTIPFASTPAGSYVPKVPYTVPNKTGTGFLAQAETITPNASPPLATLDSTDELLHDFWDTMLPQEVFGAVHGQPNLNVNHGMPWWENAQNGPSALNST